MFVVSDMVGVYNEKRAGVEAWGPHDPAPEGIMEAVCIFLIHRSIPLSPSQTLSGDVTVREVQRSGAYHPFGALSQIVFEWARNEKAAGLFFF